MRRRANRSRRRLRPAPIFVVLLIANVAAGIFYSPITSVVRVKVEGALPHDRARIEKILAGMHNVPCAQVPARALESAVADLPQARAASLDRNFFGSGRLNVSYRVPVARLEGAQSVALTDDGALVPVEAPLGELPVLRLPATVNAPMLSLVGSWESMRLAELAQQAAALLPQRRFSIVAAPERVWLNVDATQVILGSCDDLPKKLGVLRERLERQPEFFSTVEKLNLTAPDRPVVVLKKVEASN